MDIDQIQNDFWKEKMILFARQNTRTHDALGTLAEVEQQIAKIEMLYPSMESQKEISSSSVSWELCVSPNFHIRLFIQRQCKISFTGKTPNGFEKIADSKLFYSPFPELLHFLRHFDEYTAELYRVKEDALRNRTRLKLAGEFIRAWVQKFFGTEGIVWNLKSEGDTFVLEYVRNEETVCVKLHPDTFVEQLKLVKI